MFELARNWEVTESLLPSAGRTHPIVQMKSPWLREAQRPTKTLRSNVQQHGEQNNSLIVHSTTENTFSAITICTQNYTHTRTGVFINQVPFAIPDFWQVTQNFNCFSFPIYKMKIQLSNISQWNLSDWSRHVSLKFLKYRQNTMLKYTQPTQPSQTQYIHNQTQHHPPQNLPLLLYSDSWLLEPKSSLPSKAGTWSCLRLPLTSIPSYPNIIDLCALHPVYLLHRLKAINDSLLITGYNRLS